MSLTVTELFDQQSGGLYNTQWERQYTRVFRVVSSDGTDGAIAVVTASGIPQVYTYYSFGDPTTSESDDYAICTEVRAERQGDSPRHWKVYCSYDTNYNVNGNDSNNPLNQASVLTGSGLLVAIAAMQDYSGKAIQNSAGDLFDPPLTFQSSQTQIKVQKNLSTGSWNPYVGAQSMDKVNSATFLGASANYLKCDGVEFSEQEEQGLTYWSAVYTFTYNPLGWIPTKVLDIGYRHKQSCPPKSGGGANVTAQVNNTDYVGGPTVQKLLNGSGSVIDDPTNASTPPVYLSFQLNATQDFSTIGIYP